MPAEASPGIEAAPARGRAPAVRLGRQRPPLVISYHAVSSTWSSPLAISAGRLEAQLASLRERGYVGLTLGEAERRRREATLPEKALVVTFDDGYASVLRARAVLARLELPATVFVVTGFVSSGKPMRWAGIEAWSRTEFAEELIPLGWSDIESLADDGWEIGSHTVWHPSLTSLGDAALKRELTESRRAIAARLGACVSLAYPYGAVDRRVVAAASDAGYSTACTLGRWQPREGNLERARIGLYAGDGNLRAWLKLSGISRAIRQAPLRRANGQRRR